MTGPRRDGVGSKLSAYSKAQEIKQTGSEKVTRLAQLVGGADASSGRSLEKDSKIRRISRFVGHPMLLSPCLRTRNLDRY